MLASTRQEPSEEWLIWWTVWFFHFSVNQTLFVLFTAAITTCQSMCNKGIIHRKLTTVSFTSDVLSDCCWWKAAHSLHWYLQLDRSLKPQYNYCLFYWAFCVHLLQLSCYLNFHERNYLFSSTGIKYGDAEIPLAANKGYNWQKMELKRGIVIM